MGNYFRKVQVKRMLATVMAIVTLLVGMNLNQIVFAETAVQYVTLYFVDNTAEQWIKAIDNTNGH